MTTKVGCGLQMSPEGRSRLGASDRRVLPWYSFWSLIGTFNCLSICFITWHTFALPGCTSTEKFVSDVDVSIVILSLLLINLRFLIGRPLLKESPKETKTTMFDNDADRKPEQNRIKISVILLKCVFSTNLSTHMVRTILGDPGAVSWGGKK